MLFDENFTVSVEAPSTVTKLEGQHRMDRRRRPSMPSAQTLRRISFQRDSERGLWFFATLVQPKQ
jgi:hypothetical protein